MLNNGGGDLRQKMALRYRKINEIYSNFGDKIDGKNFVIFYFKKKTKLITNITNIINI